MLSPAEDQGRGSGTPNSGPKGEKVSGRGGVKGSGGLAVTGDVSRCLTGARPDRVRRTRGAPCPDASGQAGRLGPKQSGGSALRAGSQCAPVGATRKVPAARAGRTEGGARALGGVRARTTRCARAGRSVTARRRPAPAGEGPARAGRGGARAGPPGLPGSAGVAACGRLTCSCRRTPLGPPLSGRGE